MLRLIFFALFLGASSPSSAQDLGGIYDTPLGTMRLEGGAGQWKGILLQPSSTCPFKAGDEVLKATLLDDSLAGKLRTCLSGKGCKQKEAWANTVLLAGEGKLSGAVNAPKPCRAPFGAKGGVQLVKAGAATTKSPPPHVAPAPPKATPDPKLAREKAQGLMRDGANFLNEGNFEAARKRFEEAIAVDAHIPEAYNGVGVTYRMRNELSDALVWYKKALVVDPDFGDAYYNMACLYALQKKDEMALRYLKIAAMNGYVSAEGIDGDPDLAPLHDAPEYQALRKKM